MEPAVSPNQLKKPVKPFWKNPATESPISFGLDHDRAVGDHEAEQGHQDQHGKGGPSPVPCEESFEKPGHGIRSSR